MFYMKIPLSEKNNIEHENPTEWEGREGSPKMNGPGCKVILIPLITKCSILN